MKIGITCYPTYGGSGIVATELGLELARRGHEVHFITYANPIRLDTATDRVAYHEVEVSAYPLFQYPPYCLALATRMAEVAERHALDILHVHYAIPHSISALLARNLLKPRRYLPFVTTLHGTDVTLVGQEPSFFPITRYSIEESDGVTSISEHLRQETLDVFGVEKPIEVIPNFVCTSTYRPAPDREPGLVMMHISNFRPVKRVVDCIRILAEVRKQVPAELWMVGDGPDRSAAEAMAQDLGVHAHVRFMGKQSQVWNLLPQADVLLLPSRMESFGLAALEGMSCGLVPIASRVGGLPEVITDGEDGFLCAMGDVAEFAGRAVQVFTSSELRHRLSAAARAKAERQYSSTLVLPRYEAFYQRMIAQSGG
jgi:N-acetyl-alpha-D-glucosaminyl L-malate synthase BshA